MCYFPVNFINNNGSQTGQFRLKLFDGAYNTDLNTIVNSNGFYLHVNTISGKLPPSFYCHL